MSRSFKTKAIKAIFATALISLVACKPGAESDKPPIHLNPNMDFQEKFKAQASTDFFADGRTMRQPAEGTIARGHLNADDAIYRGLDADGKPVKTAPSLEDLGWDGDMKSFLERGQQRYEIYCTPCHGSTGDAVGTVALRGYPAVANLLQDIYRQKTDGDFYSAIINGVNNGNMPSYAAQIADVKDRWAIVAYLRVLQQAAKNQSK